MTKGKVLLVDDELIFLVAHREELEDVGYEIQTALTGKEAITIAGKEKFDIAFVDLVMPKMNGVEICKEVKKISPNVEIVLVSGHPSEIQKHKEQFMNAGGREEILQKSLDENGLIIMAEKIMKEKRKIDEVV